MRAVTPTGERASAAEAVPHLYDRLSFPVL